MINDGYFVQSNGINLDYYIKFFDNYQKDSKRRINELNELKNDSIYTGFKNNKFKPSEVITEKMAIEQINKANRLVDYHKRMIKNVQNELNIIQSDPFTKYKYQVILDQVQKKWNPEK